MIKRLAAILDFATMVGPMTAGSGALKKSNKYVLVYMSAKFHACRQICTIPPFRAWTNIITVNSKHDFMIDPIACI